MQANPATDNNREVGKVCLAHLSKAVHGHWTLAGAIGMQGDYTGLVLQLDSIILTVYSNTRGSPQHSSPEGLLSVIPFDVPP